MTATVRKKLAAFALAVAASFGVGAAVGAVVGPVDVGSDREPTGPEHTPTGPEHGASHGDG